MTSGLGRSRGASGIVKFPPGPRFDEVSNLFTGKIFMVIDVSGSMAGRRLSEATGGASDLLTQAIENSYMAGVISFDTSARMDLDLTTDPTEVDQTLRSLKIRGGTDMSTGIRVAHERLRGEPGERAMAIFSDGETNKSTAIAAAKAAIGDGIRIVASLGGSADPEFMKQIVTPGENVVLGDDSDVRQNISGLSASLTPAWKAGRS